MKVIFGQKGQPVGSVEGDALFDKQGGQIGFIDSQHIYKFVDGAFIGFYVGGIVYNAYKAPQGFTEGCSSKLLPLPPKMGMLPSRVASLGTDVSSTNHRHPPEFLRDLLPAGNINSLRDGWFQ
jgi:hypothetical protein